MAGSSGTNPILSAIHLSCPFNNLARPSGFSWAIAGNAAASCLDLRPSVGRKQARFGHMGSFYGATKEAEWHSGPVWRPRRQRALGRLWHPHLRGPRPKKQRVGQSRETAAAVRPAAGPPRPPSPGGEQTIRAVANHEGPRSSRLASRRPARKLAWVRRRWTVSRRPRQSRGCGFLLANGAPSDGTSAWKPHSGICSDRCPGVRAIPEGDCGSARSTCFVGRSGGSPSESRRRT
jgi:hypothetical protein